MNTKYVWFNGVKYLQVDRQHIVQRENNTNLLADLYVEYGKFEITNRDFLGNKVEDIVKITLEMFYYDNDEMYPQMYCENITNIWCQNKVTAEHRYVTAEYKKYLYNLALDSYPEYFI